MKRKFIKNTLYLLACFFTIQCGSPSNENKRNPRLVQLVKETENPKEKDTASKDKTNQPESESNNISDDESNQALNSEPDSTSIDGPYELSYNNPDSNNRNAGTNRENPIKTNIILFIGDGMGPEHIKIASLYRYGQEGQLAFQKFSQSVEVTTHSANSNVTDSAAASTAMATGNKVNNGVISTYIPGDGKEAKTLLEYADEFGYATGLITTTMITDATPAGFGAHADTKTDYWDIADDYLYQTQPDILLGGGLGFEVPDQIFEQAGYVKVSSADELDKLDFSTFYDSSDSLNSSNSPNSIYNKKLWGIFAESHFPYFYNGRQNYPTLAKMTLWGIEYLDQFSGGFFLVVEEGHIDKASHLNSIDLLLPELMALDDAVIQAMEWAIQAKDQRTIIIVAADHETGGLKLIKNHGKNMTPQVSWIDTHHTSTNTLLYIWDSQISIDDPTIDNTEIFDIILSELTENNVN